MQRNRSSLLTHPLGAEYFAVELLVLPLSSYEQRASKLRHSVQNLGDALHQPLP